MKPSDPLDAVLKVRDVQRRRARLAAAQFGGAVAEIDGQMRSLGAEEADAAAALRSATGEGRIDVDRAAAIRYQLSVLRADAAGLGMQRAQAAARLEQATSLLRQADMDVKAVERLRARHEAERRREAERAADREATDLFTATRGTGGG